MLERDEFSLLVEALGLLVGKNKSEREVIIDHMLQALDDNHDGRARWLDR